MIFFNTSAFTYITRKNLKIHTKKDFLTLGILERKTDKEKKERTNQLNHKTYSAFEYLLMLSIISCPTWK